jgi:16S rRNA processing protein RimM
MRTEECFQLGIISRTHGKNGALVLKLDTDRPEAYTKLESVLLEMQDELVPFFIDELNPIKAKEFQVFFEDVPPGEASRLIGKKIFLPLEFLPKLTGKQFYFHEVVGFGVIDAGLGKIGMVKEIIERYPQHVILANNDEHDILIPITDEILQRIDRNEKQIFVDCPEGLLDIYLNDSE